MVKLRNFTTDDVETLRQLHYCDMSAPDVSQMICDWNRFEYQGRYFEMFAVTVDDKIVGELSLYQHSESVVSVGLEVYPKFQRQGLGKQAIVSALQICKNKGFKIVCNQVRTDNEPSIALSKSLGFESDLYRYKNQRDHEVYLFLKALD